MDLYARVSIQRTPSHKKWTYIQSIHNFHPLPKTRSASGVSKIGITMDSRRTESLDLRNTLVLLAGRVSHRGFLVPVELGDKGSILFSVGRILAILAGTLDRAHSWRFAHWLATEKTHFDREL